MNKLISPYKLRKRTFAVCNRFWCHYVMTEGICHNFVCFIFTILIYTKIYCEIMNNSKELLKTNTNYNTFSNNLKVIRTFLMIQKAKERSRLLKDDITVNVFRYIVKSRNIYFWTLELRFKEKFSTGTTTEERVYILCFINIIIVDRRLMISIIDINNGPPVGRYSWTVRSGKCTRYRIVWSEQ